MNAYSILASGFALGFLTALIVKKIKAHDAEQSRMLPRSAPYKAERKPREAVAVECINCSYRLYITGVDADAGRCPECGELNALWPVPAGSAVQHPD